MLSVSQPKSYLNPSYHTKLYRFALGGVLAAIGTPAQYWSVSDRKLVLAHEIYRGFRPEKIRD